MIFIKTAILLQLKHKQLNRILLPSCDLSSSFEIMTIICDFFNNKHRLGQGSVLYSIPTYSYFMWISYGCRTFCTHNSPTHHRTHTQNLWYHSINWQISTDRKATAHKGQQFLKFRCFGFIILAICFIMGIIHFKTQISKIVRSRLSGILALAYYVKCHFRKINGIFSSLF